MKSYKVRKADEEDLRERREEGVYDINRDRLVYVNRIGRLSPTHLSRGFDEVYKVGIEDWSRRYSVYWEDGFKIREISIFEEAEIAELQLNNRGLQLREPKTRELLDPYDFGIFAPGLTVIKPVEKLEYSEKNSKKIFFERLGIKTV